MQHALYRDGHEQAKPVSPTDLYALNKLQINTWHECRVRSTKISDNPNPT